VSENNNKEKAILKFFKRILRPVVSTAESDIALPRVYNRSEHNISRAQISDNALKVLYRLKKAGFEAYLVGGCVRDLLLGREPKDFDVATNARPEQVKATFRNCRLIGRRFRLAHVYFGREIIEVATFRGSEAHESDLQRVHEDGRLLRDNVFGTIEEDVWRRDFTVNSLYYNIRDFSIIDYTGGMQDHADSVLKLIGDPQVRYREDPVRMLRAVRFAVKLGFKISPETEQPIHELAHLLQGIPAARLFDEVLKLFLAGKGLETFEMLRHYGLFKILFPATEQSLAKEQNEFPRLFIARALENSDQRIAQNKSVTPYFLLSVFLWEPLQDLYQLKLQQGLEDIVAWQQAANEVLNKQVRIVSIPKRFTQAMRDVWFLQSRFSRRTGGRPYRLLSHPRFRAAYDFLALRAETGDVDQELVDWWTKFQFANADQQRRMTQPAKKMAGKRQRKRHHRTATSKNTNV
jgi:poly(A) polymerase